MNPNLPSAISMLMLGVSDMSQSVAFYRDTLNLVLNHESPEFSFFGAGAINLILSVPLGRKSPGAGGLEVIFPVASVAASHELLTLRGCLFVQGPHEVTPGSWAANFTDPNGHLLTIFGPA